MAQSQLHLRGGRLLEVVVKRPGAVEWRVGLDDGTAAQAIAYPALSGSLSPGQRVWLNTTAVELGLGTGGVHFVLGPWDPSPPAAEIGAAPERAAGHLMKLRYTPLQHAIPALEEGASPFPEPDELGGMPVLAAELHSAAMAAALAARACGARRVVYVMTDGAALPLPFSALVARLRAEGVLAGTITAGQAFGGDLEAVTPASALAAARSVFQADLAIIAQGPGSAGTASTLGFSGLGQAEHLNVTAALGGLPVAALRVSFADPRPRHRGLSHHSATVLGRMALARCAVAVPALGPTEDVELRRGIDAAGLPSRHDVRRVKADDLLVALEPYRAELTTMGRTVAQDPAFFLAAAAAARLSLEPEAGCRWQVDG